ncbi:MAG: CoA pyrophosphatase [Proteobacteria bacterium]|nr:CoA pyrophosphatase [Pseudomonadota bacterium]
MTRPLILDPETVPVVPAPPLGPALAPARLDPDSLRERLRQKRMPRTLRPGDGLLGPTGVWTPAAVLVPLVPRPDGLQVLLTRRAAHLAKHPGQIAFPGGRSDPGDADAVATALREAQEEIGLAPASVEVLGSLPAYHTVTGYAVTPVVGLVSDPKLVLHAGEVDEAFEVPLAFLMDPANHRRHLWTQGGVTRDYHSMPWTPPAGAADKGPEAYFIWGATAAMLRNLYLVLQDQ